MSSSATGVAPQAASANAAHRGEARLAHLDRLRVVACFGIVWFHLGPESSRLIGYAGLPVFLLAFFALSVKTLMQAPPLGELLRRRATRLLLPWLFWVAVYAAVRTARVIAHGRPAGDVLLHLNPLYGTEIHLWYLPFAFLCAAALAAAPAAWWRWAGSRGAAAGLSIFGAALLLGLGLDPPVLPDPLGQYCFALPSIPLGVAIGAAHVVDRRFPGAQGPALLLTTAVTLIACALLEQAGMRGTWIPYAIATPLVCAAVAWPGRGGRFTTALADLNLGIYAIHPLVHIVVAKYVDLSQRLELRVVLYYLISALLCAGLRRLGVRGVI